MPLVPSATVFRPRPFPTLPLALGALAWVAAAGCAIGPDYERPAMAAPPAFKEAAGWKVATPAEADGTKPWWEIFGDTALNDLEERLVRSNLTLVKVAADYEQARQVARADRAGLWPGLSGSASAERSQSPGAEAAGERPPANLYAASLAATWSPDLWGKLRRGNRAAVALAQAAAANVAATRLSLESALAGDYVAVRVLDEKRRLIGNAVEAYRRTLVISQNRYSVGVVARSDVISAQAQLDSTRARWLDTGIQRAALEHAIATLVAATPEAYALPPRPAFALTLPAIPARLPSELLERRPDIAEAERQVAAANELIGVQTAGYFPQLTLTGGGGYEGSPVRELLDAPFRFWSLGAQAGVTVLDWGARHDSVRAAQAVYEGSVANYRAAVLSAFQQVEDALSSLRILEAEGQAEDAAVAEAAEAARIALNEYSSGTVDYTTVASAQVTELTDRESALAILQARLSSGIGLLAALGGGWRSDALASPRQVLANTTQNPVTAAAADDVASLVLQNGHGSVAANP